MENVNNNQGGGVGSDGAGGGGGGGWLFHSAVPTGAAVGVGVCAGLAYAVWNMYQSNKKLKELEKKVQGHQVYIKQDQLYKLDEVEDALTKRQDALCNNKDYWVLKELEAKALLKASALENVFPDISNTLKTILKEDQHCGSNLSYLGTGNKRQNGRLMWEEMDKLRKILERTVESPEVDI